MRQRTTRAKSVAPMREADTLSQLVCLAVGHVQPTITY
jgi:hypothetical protein